MIFAGENNKFRGDVIDVSSRTETFTNMICFGNTMCVIALNEMSSENVVTIHI